MAETLSKAEQQEAAEEVEYYQEHHESKKKKTGYDATDNNDTYEEARDQHYKEEERKSNRVSREERAEMEEEIEYHEKIHPRKKQPSYPGGPADSFELKQPGHGAMMTLSPLEIGEYKEELEYREKTASKSKRHDPPMTYAESVGFDTAYAMHGETKRGKNLPEGMFGYDIEMDYFHNVSQKDNRRINPRGETMFGDPIGPQRSRGRVVEDMFRSFGRGVSAVRDDIYGYRRVYEPMSNAFHIDTRSIRSSGIGNINPFSPARSGSYRMMNINPFGVGRTSRSISPKKKGRKSKRSPDTDGIPPSLSWMF